MGEDARTRQSRLTMQHLMILLGQPAAPSKHMPKCATLLPCLEDPQYAYPTFNRRDPGTVWTPQASFGRH